MSPADEAELAEAMRAARTPLRIRGGGTRRRPRPPVRARTLWHRWGCRGITLYEPGALTLVARAGTPLAEVEADAGAEGQRLPFEPMDHRGRYWARRGRADHRRDGGGQCLGAAPVQAGACRDSLIGVRFVDGTGR
jgi:glycolate oxidase FAD binding subunit